MAYPFLNYLFCCCIPDNKELPTEDKSKQLGEQLLSNLDKKTKKKLLKKVKKKSNLPEAEQKKDPLASLGFGIVAYRDILFNFIWTFTLFTILALPAFYMYSDGSAYSNQIAALKGFEELSIGNLGYSSVQCSSVPLTVGQITLSCPYGNIGEIHDYGIRSYPHTASDLCLNNDISAPCKPDGQVGAFANLKKTEYSDKANVAITFDTADFYTSGA